MTYLGVNLTYPPESGLPIPKIAHRELSYYFEILHGFLSDQNNKIATLQKSDTPPLPPTMIYLGVNSTFLQEGVVLGF